MKRFDEMSTEALSKECAEAEAALRFAASHGAELPEGAWDGIRAMQAELSDRTKGDPAAPSPGPQAIVSKLFEP